MLPQFIQPEAGSVLAQSLWLGLVQIAIGTSVNLAALLGASGVAAWFGRNPTWLALQRHVMGLVLGALAVRLLLQPRNAA